MTKILAHYRFTFENGMSQTKTLIRHEDYINIIKPMQEKIHFLEVNKQNKEAKALKKELDETFGEFWFTDRSAYYRAISSGFIDSLLAGGEPAPVVAEEFKP